MQEFVFAVRYIVGVIRFSAAVGMYLASIAASLQVNAAAQCLPPPVFIDFWLEGMACCLHVCMACYLHVCWPYAAGRANRWDRISAVLRVDAIFFLIFMNNTINQKK